MKESLRLFKAIVISDKSRKKASKELLTETLKKGFVFSPEVVANYSEKELFKLIEVIEKDIGLTPEQMNSSFHKSWKKVKTASMEQLILEQITHYFTTYGFELFGVYSPDSVYIPNEDLDIPLLKEGINIVVIKGYTKKELENKILELVKSGIALSEETVKDVVELFKSVDIDKKELENVKNKEVKIALYDYFEIVPEHPIEFLRYAIFKVTGKTLLIKNDALIALIKANNNLKISKLFYLYKKQHGLEKLASIFHRFKPLFLAFKTNDQLKAFVNKIRKLAKKHHKPMPQDYLNDITALIRKGRIDTEKLKSELKRVNVWRKIRLAYALKFRTKDINSIMYRVRNGKAYSTHFNFDKQTTAKRIYDIVLASIIADIKPNVKGKKIYIPKHITYTLPATEKQFTGYFPSGSYVTIPKDMVFGVYWENVGGHRIDLDLSIVNASGKMGWDASYRRENGDILFSGDVTDAHNGASELFYVRKQKTEAHILFVNYFNYDEKVEVPFKIVVAKEEVKNLKQNYMVDPNNVMAIAKTTINQKQKILGILITTTDECRFYFTEAYLGNSITSSSDKEYVTHARTYLVEFYKEAISLNEVLEEAGAKVVEVKEKCDIDLTPEVLEKDTILNLIK